MSTRLCSACLWLTMVCTACGSSNDQDTALFDEAEGAQPDVGGAGARAGNDASNGSRGSTMSSDGTGATSGSGSPSTSGSVANSGFAGSSGDVQARRDAYAVPGGVFDMGRSTGGADACPEAMECLSAELPEHSVYVAGFSLDATEVTVAEFRHFVSEFAGAPPPGSGAHPDDALSGWQAEYDSALPSDADSLRSALLCDEAATFVEEPGPNDELPINCVTWYEALAFCISRGGRLPSEAEWEFAAAGGSENRLYPWGSDAASEARAAVYPSNLIQVGSLPDGSARWQHADLAGNVWEWVLDWLDPTYYQNVGDDCVNCVSSAAGTHRGLRGGAFSFDATAARAAARSGELPGERKRSVGFRCAYDD